MATQFPFHTDVRLEFSSARPVRARIRVRVPSWAAHEMDIHVSGHVAAKGKPGSYVALDRTWSNGDTLSFTLPAALRVARYTGVTQVPAHDRFAILYGPVLLAAVGAPEVTLSGVDVKRPESLAGLLKPKPGEPLHYTVEHNPGIEFMPYWLVDQQPFNCFPAVRAFA